MRAKYTHRTNLRFVLCVFRPAGGCRRWRGGAVWGSPHSGGLPQTAFAFRCRSTHRLTQPEKGRRHDTAQLHPNVEAVQCQRAHLLCHQPNQTGEPIRHLYRKAEAVVSQYNRELAEWERKVQERRQPVKMEPPPETRSVRERLRRLQDEGRRKQPQPRKRAADRDSR